MSRKFLFKLAVSIVALAIILPSAFSAAEMIMSVTTALDTVQTVTYTVDGEYIKDIEDDVTVSELLDAFGDSSGYITKATGYRMAASSRVGTGYKLVTDTKTYTLIVNGDINGDSYVTTKDVIRAKKIIEMGNNGDHIYAVDVNKDGVLGYDDVNQLSDFVIKNKPEYGIGEMPAVDLGDDFYATIGLSHAETVVAANLDNNVITAPASASPNTVWHFTRNADETYTIENVAMGTALDVAYAKSDFGTNVGVYKHSNTLNQKWRITEKDGGYVLATACAEDRVLDVYAASTKDGANIQIYGLNYTPAQIFTIDKVDGIDVSSTEAYFDSFSSLDYPTQFYGNLNYGTRFISAGSANNACVLNQRQFWKFELQSDGTYKITNTFNGKVLDVDGAKMENFANVQTYESNDTAAQRWRIYIKDGKALLCSAKDPGFVVDLNGGFDLENGNIQLYTFNDTAAQWFTFTDVVDRLPEYKVTCPYNQIVYGRYETLEEAKANVKDYLGQLVYNLSGSLLYNPCPSYMAAKILHNAKRASDFAAANGFVYGHADINPGYNWQNLDINNPTVKDERCSSCDRLVDWALWLSGVQAAQGNVTSHGPVVYEQVVWIPKLNYIKITDPSQLKPGDLVFTTYDYTKPGTPGHAFICASNNMGGNLYLRYDHGSVQRIRYMPNNASGVPYNYFLDGKAPFVERIGTADQPTFYYAYRPID